MIFLLNNWKCLLKIGVYALIVLGTLYVVHLYNKVGELEGENNTIQDSLNYSNGFIKKYETARAENEAMSRQLTAQLQGQKDDQKCPISPAVRNVIAKLQ